ncbi:rod shape-determining protein MreD [Paenibacillus sp.]|uniref:rod shape-determining protein MreD n=1 Tax=Paenibacillus sp. TaxID=58172 RepID=UPI002811477C|nr:rod shape-determining protein MreD [Paenibacillus sp.]
MSNASTLKWMLLTLTLLFFFLLESSLLPWVTPLTWRSELSIYPKLVLISTVYISVFTNRHIGLAYGLAFGLLQDVQFYGHMIGVNAFAYGLAAYVAGLLIRPNLVSLFSVFLIQLSALLLYETSTYAIYRLFSVTDSDFGWMFVHGMLPSILISLFLALALYIPARKWLEAPRSERDSDDE